MDSVGRGGRRRARNAQVGGTETHLTAHGGRADPAYGSEGWGFESLRAALHIVLVRRCVHLRAALRDGFRRVPGGVLAHQLLTVAVASPVLGARFVPEEEAMSPTDAVGTAACGGDGDAGLDARGRSSGSSRSSRRIPSSAMWRLLFVTGMWRGEIPACGGSTSTSRWVASRCSTRCSCATGPSPRGRRLRDHGVCWRWILARPEG